MSRVGILQSVYDGNIHKKISAAAYDSNLHTTYTQIPQQTPKPTFNPEKHLQYYATSTGKAQYDETKRITMAQLGHGSKPNQISPIGVSDPFPLFTQEAVDIMRSEVLQRDNFLKYARYSFNSTSGLDSVVRGYVKTEGVVNCPFIYQAWTHPTTTELVSRMAGVDLDVIMDYEIAQVNVSMRDQDTVIEEVKKVERSMSEGSSEIPAVVGWHHDSYPFVCVLMLSETTNMIGGETSLRMGHDISGGGDGNMFGKVAVVPGPQRGSACVLQGRLIEHIAPAPQGVSERITMVTSYRARGASLPDTSVLGTVKPEVNFGSRYNEFYQEWIGYRADLMKDKLDLIKTNCRGKAGNGKFDKTKTIEALKEVEAYLKTTYEEMVLTPEEEAKMYRKGSIV
ncbi:uncharacterized protein LODBEIA_P33820 [Lodderomyces beijingensis]|uniref:Uncharacterized protein n=1 Tax=Lodderomyces beijingensis TaxID=1775926 RepID=A0ABP0ZLY5_9ASCO